MTRWHHDDDIWANGNVQIKRESREYTVVRNCIQEWNNYYKMWARIYHVPGYFLKFNFQENPRVLLEYYFEFLLFFFLKGLISLFLRLKDVSHKELGV